jgi:nucleotide-binding universal stress UspA family protein
MCLARSRVRPVTDFSRASRGDAVPGGLVERRHVEESAGAGLLVDGRRGHGGFAGLVLGSVSQHVAAYAKCPVAVIR